MNERGGWDLFVPFRLGLDGPTETIVTLAAVWGPGVLGDLTVQAYAAPARLRVYAAPGRVPLQTGLVAVPRVIGDRVWAGVFSIITDAPAGLQAMTLQGTDLHTFALGGVVPWSPWWLVLVAANGSALDNEVWGGIKVTVFEGEARNWKPVPRAVAAEPRKRVWGASSQIMGVRG